MGPVFLIAGKELRDSLRNRWIVSATLLMAGLALALAFLGSAPVGTVGASSLAVTVVSLATLSVFLAPLIALLLSYDTIVGDINRGTMLLLLSYPVARWQVLCGKFLGHVCVIAVATVIGYGGAGAAVGLLHETTDAGDWNAFAILVASTVLLGACFVALGLLISVSVRERGAAVGLAVVLWLVFVVLYDLALLGVLVADQGETLNGALFNGLLMLNPTDAYRVLNLTTSPDVAGFAGLAGVGASSGLLGSQAIATLSAWTAAPLALAFLLFHRREI